MNAEEIIKRIQTAEKKDQCEGISKSQPAHPFSRRM